MSKRLVSTDKLTWNKETQTFSTEASDLGLLEIPNTVKVFNPKTQDSRVFTFWKKDMDKTNEDTYGFWYKSKNLKLLIIND
jgi:hypothetical protein